MPKRPSYVSIRARQRNILEGLGTTDQRYAEAAARFGVTPRELKRFVETKPKTLRRNFNRSPATRKLFEEGKRSEVRETLGVQRIKRYKYRERDIQNLKNLQLKPREFVSRTQIGEQIQNLYSTREFARYDWASYAREKELPTSIHMIRFLHDNGYMSNADYRAAVTAWAEIYDVDDDIVDEYMADFDLEDIA